MWLKQAQLLCTYLKQPCAAMSNMPQKPGKRLLSFWRDHEGLGYRATQNFGHIRIALVAVLGFCIYRLPNSRCGMQPRTLLVYLCFGCTKTYKLNRNPRKGFPSLTAAELLPSCTTSGFSSDNYGRTRGLIFSHIWIFSSAEGEKTVRKRSQTRPEDVL